LFAGRKLLIADDSPYYRTVIGLTFTDEGMEVKTAEDGRQALEIIERSTPDVILASVSMPGTSGYELCRLIKQSERFGHIPVMLLTGLHEHFDAAEARLARRLASITAPSVEELRTLTVEELPTDFTIAKTRRGLGLFRTRRRRR